MPTDPQPYTDIRQMPIQVGDLIIINDEIIASVIGAHVSGQLTIKTAPQPGAFLYDVLFKCRCEVSERRDTHRINILRDDTHARIINGDDLLAVLKL